MSLLSNIFRLFQHIRDIVHVDSFMNRHYRHEFAKRSAVGRASSTSELVSLILFNSFRIFVNVNAKQNEKWIK